MTTPALHIEPPGDEELEEAGCAAALASLGLSPARLRRILDGRSPARAWRELLVGVHPEDPEGRIRALLVPGLPGVLWRRCRSAGVSVVPIGSVSYPTSLATDNEAPAVLFLSGRPGALEGWPRVAVVGTRSASAVGREVAADIGRSLAGSGAVVVSGLAPGIDSAALAGAIDAEAGVAVAVLGSAHHGLRDPGQKRLAWGIERRGCVASELPPGADSARWRFAVRNRVMASLAQLVVVVECHRAGGALHTVRAARRRGVPVAAVPGSVRASAAEGANELLVEGALCVRHGDDVVTLLGSLTEWDPVRPVASTGEEPAADEHVLDGPTRGLLEALDGEATALDALVLRTGQSVASVALALERLAEAGLASSDAGFWSRTRSQRRRRAPMGHRGVE